MIVDGVFLFGKYAGEAVGDVVRSDRAFVQWAIESSDMLALTAQEFLTLSSSVIAAAVQDAAETAAPLAVEPPPIPPELLAVEPPPIPPELMADSFYFEGDLVPSDPRALFDEVRQALKIEWTDEQRQALDQIEDWLRGGEPFFALMGPAGTGKSTLIREIAERHSSASLTAMTGKAALRLAECAGRPASTLHKVLYWPPKPGQELRFTRLRDPVGYLVVVDESSLMTPSVYADLQRWGDDIRYLLVGDTFQLPPVITDKQELERFGEDYSVFSRVSGVALKTVMRNSGGVLEAATHVRESGEICRRSIPDADGGYEYIRDMNTIKRAVEDYCADPEDHMLITWRNANRMAANRMIRERLGRGGPLPDVGEPVLMKKNGQGFMNGETVICAGFEAGPQIASVKTLWMKVEGHDERVLVSYEGGGPKKNGEVFDGQSPWIEDWKGYHVALNKGMYHEPIPVTWGYCHTAHSAQGSQARRVTVFLDRGDVRSSHFTKITTLPTGDKATFAARWVYTATTRSKKRTTMIVGR